jgi:hypothetical protein
MKRCYAIGIGGTGSKCIEALVHGAAAGLGPQKIALGIVDQDGSNGNVARVRETIDLYRDLYRSLRSGDCSLGDSALFRSEIETSPEPIWSPLPEKQSTLAGHFHRSALQRKGRFLFDALFEDERERRQALDEGFRGRPAVGAAAMFSAASKGEGFWTRLFEDLREAGSAADIRICVFASIFGGTGAAGFPTITRMIRDIAERHRGKVTIGGILSLPYFTFPDADDSAQSNLALAKNFSRATQQALLYYHSLLVHSHPGLFNYLYLVGANRPFTLPNLGAGSNGQKNPALLPELLAAVGALHLFHRDDQAPTQTRVLRAGHTSAQAVKWEDIPRVASNAESHDVRDSFARLLRFAIAYRSVYRPYLKQSTPRAVANQVWFHNLIAKPGVDLAQQRTQRTLTTLDGYCSALLQWCRDISDNRGPNDVAVQLFQLGQFAQADAIEMPQDANGIRRAFDSAVTVEHARGLADVFTFLSSRRVAPDRRGLGIFADQLFNGCQLYSGD